MRVLFVLCVASVAWSLPITEVPGEVELLQKIAFRPHDYHNYTCDQCWRMTRTLEGMCKDNHHSSKDILSDFRPYCAKNVAPIATDKTWDTLNEMCGMYYQFVSDLYCPIDPCLQVTRQSTLAPDAVCKLLHCNGDAAPIQPSPAPAEPLTCVAYVNHISEFCESGDVSINNACETFEGHPFEVDGCEVVRSRMAELTAPQDMCKALQCDPLKMDADEFCEKVLTLPPHDRVVVAEYETYLSTINGTAQNLTMGYGVNVTRATLGYNCKNKEAFNKTTDNLLADIQAACNGLKSCLFPNPRLDKELVEKVSNSECDEDFSFRFTCKTDGKIHTVTVPKDATYELIPIDCSDEVPKFPVAQGIDTVPDFSPDVDIYNQPRDMRNAVYIEK